MSTRENTQDLVEAPDEATPAKSVLSPSFSVLTPGVSAEEIAALSAVLSAMSAAGDETDDTGPRPQWGTPARAMRHTPAPAPGGWQLSRLPC